MKSLQIDGQDLGIIHGKKTVKHSRIWLTEKPSVELRSSSWQVVVEGHDQKIRTVGFVRPPQEQRARATYDDLSKVDVLEAFLEGRDS